MRSLSKQSPTNKPKTDERNKVTVEITKPIAIFVTVHSDEKQTKKFYKIMVKTANPVEWILYI